MERLVLWYRGEGQKTFADVARDLPAGAYVLQAAPQGLFLVRAERASLEHAFTRADGWVVAADDLVA